MTKPEVLDRLCALVSNVGANVYGSELTHDCFCPSGGPDADLRFQSVDPEIVCFIENAVREKIARGRS